MQAQIPDAVGLTKLAMVALLGASIPFSQADLNPWAQWGLAGLVVGFTLWRDHQREARLEHQLRDQHTWTRDRLLAALEHHTAVMERLDRLERAIQPPK